VTPAARTYLGPLLRAADLSVMLVSGDYAPSAAHATTADVRPFEVRGPGYVAGGRPLANVRLSPDGLRLLAEDAVWPEVAIAAMWAVVYRRASGELVSWARVGVSLGPAAGGGGRWRERRADDGPFAVNWPGGVVLRLAGGQPPGG
jgi:hypothetical protein